MLSAPILWLIAGLMLCLLELFVPTAFVELTMGLSALIVGCLAWVGLWLVLSIGLILLLRRLLPKSARNRLEHTREAKTLTGIAPGQTGRVIYEGNSWQARCEDERLELAPDQEVYVVGRRGTTLIVLPASLVDLD
jgi:membrane protein implicated in regulation of membrane protease activity